VKKIGIGMIGCGAMGQAVARLVLAQSDRVEIVALRDPDPRSINQTLKEISPGATVHNNHRDLVNDDRVDWVMIASWNCFHKRHAIAAFEAGKHVFCQKPLAINLEDCVAMHKAWKKSGVMFNIGFTLRYAAHYRKIKQLLEQGVVGDIVSMEFNETLDFNHGGYIMGDWRRLTEYAGTHLLEKCCHDVDLVNWMVGSRAARVASFGGLNFFRPENARHIKRIGKDKQGRPPFQSWGGLFNLNPFTSDKDIVDNQVAIIEFANGARAAFHTNCNAGIIERRMYILGTEGALRADLATGSIETRRVGFDTKIEKAPTGARGGHGGGDPVLAKELVASMLRGKRPSVGLEEGMAASLTCFAIDRAMETGRVVDVAPAWKRAGLAAK